MDRPISAGFDIYDIITDYRQVDYQGNTLALGLRLGFPTSEFSSGRAALHDQRGNGDAFLRGAYGEFSSGGQRDHLVGRIQLHLQHASTILSNPARDSLSSSVRILPVSAATRSISDRWSRAGFITRCSGTSSLAR